MARLNDLTVAMPRADDIVEFLHAERALPHALDEALEDFDVDGGLDDVDGFRTV